VLWNVKLEVKEESESAEILKEVFSGDKPRRGKTNFHS